MGFLQISSRVGAASAPWVSEGLKSVHHVVPFLVMGASSFIATALMFLLPETKEKELLKLLKMKRSKERS